MCMGVDGVSLHVQCHYHIVCGQVPDTLIRTDILLVYFDLWLPAISHKNLSYIYMLLLGWKGTKS